MFPFYTSRAKTPGTLRTEGGPNRATDSFRESKIARLSSATDRDGYWGLDV